MTVQAHAEDADINVLMRRYGITGKLPDNPRLPTYGDFSEVTDFRSALNAVRGAQESFMEIPAEIRARFDNDPQLFLEYCENPANAAGLVQLGLAKAPLAPPPGPPGPGGTGAPPPSVPSTSGPAPGTAPAVPST